MIRFVLKETDVVNYLASDETQAAPRGRVPKALVPKTYRVDEISARHHEIARLVLLGTKNKEISRMLGVTECFVSNVRNSPVVKEQLDLMTAERDREAVDIAVQIQEALPQCVEFLTKTVEDGEVSKALRSKNAFGLLSIGGHGATKNLSVQSVHAILTAEDIADIRERGVALAGEIGILDADVEVEAETAEEIRA